MKLLYWLGSALDDLKAFPNEARKQAGTDLRLVQHGVEPRDWRPMPAIGKGVREIRIRSDNGAFRVFYVVESRTAVYVLHAFQKKTRKTPQADLGKARNRYRLIP